MFVDAGSFRIQCGGSPSEGEMKLVEAVNGMNGAEGKTILSLLREEEFTGELISGYFKENLEQQQLSPTYQPSYDYSYAGVNATFDMRTARVEVNGTGIAHSIRGTINNYNNQIPSSPSSSSSAPEESAYHTLFSVDFIQNLLAYSVKSNQIWKNYKLDGSTFKETAFGFRLIDL